MSLLHRLEGGLIVSCQPVDDGPMDTIPTIVAMALAARAGGARALRIEGAENVVAVARACDLPIIGIVKRDLPTSPVRITPFIEDVAALADAGAAIIAVDATDRERPVAVAELLAAIHARGRLAMADLSNAAEAKAAKSMGFDILGTTMSGYTGGPVPDAPDFDFVMACRALGGAVIAEGRYNTPELAAQALRAGASAVCVGSAITRLEHVTGWFRDAVEKAGKSEIVLALDVGGTKTLLALMKGAEVLDQQVMPTANAIGTADWFEQLANTARPWSGQYAAIGAAVTGIVADGHWNALNPVTLTIPQDTPLVEKLQQAFDTDRVVAVNDAQAAAWGEYRYGAGQGRDIMFVTVSSGIGGGLVLGGKLRQGSRGLAGSIGQWTDLAGERLETRASGFGLAQRAQADGHAGDTRAIFEALERGEDWAERLVDSVAGELANALTGLQKVVDFEAVVLGGGIGLLSAFQSRLDAALMGYPALLRPRVVPARLGNLAGIVGVADLARGS